VSWLAQLPLAAPDAGSLLEGIVIFLGLLAYLVPTLIKQWQARTGQAGEGADSDEPARPGRRTPRSGGTFVGPQSSSRKPRKEALDRWRELLLGEEPAPTRKPIQVKRPAPPRPAVEAPVDRSATLVELGESIEALHQELDQSHAQLEEAHSSLPSESLTSDLVSPALAQLPTEDELESLGSQDEIGGRAPRRSAAARHAAARTSRSAWRRAVVLTEVFAPPIALRSPSETSGRMPG
jgi:hypothetical protein